MATKCFFQEHKIDYIDYKNVKLLRRFLDRFARIKQRYYTGTNLRSQKKLERAIKVARIMALIPFTK